MARPLWEERVQREAEYVEHGCKERRRTKTTDARLTQARLSRYAGRYGALLLAKAAPFLAHAGASAVAYSSSLALVQLGGMAMRISCATPIVAPWAGAAGVAAASVVAGHTSRKVQQWWEKGTNPFERGMLEGLRKEDAIVDAVMGMGLFKLLGGSFRSVLPSDLRFPGALAKESLPARGSDYATDIQRAELRLLHQRHGCHHCGSKRGPTIADHMPPNKVVHGGAEGLPKRKFLWWTLPRKVIKQRFYPECGQCSQKQAECVRTGTKKLVMHFGGFQPFYLAGILVGLRQGFEVNMTDAAVQKYVSPLVYIAFEDRHVRQKDHGSFQLELNSLRKQEEYLKLHKIAVKEKQRRV